MPLEKPFFLQLIALAEASVRYREILASVDLSQVPEHLRAGFANDLRQHRDRTAAALAQLQQPASTPIQPA